MSLVDHVRVKITPQIALAVAEWLRSTPMVLPPDWREFGKNFKRTVQRRLAAHFKKIAASKRGERNISLPRSDALLLFAFREPELRGQDGYRVFRSQSSWPKEVESFRMACRVAYWSSRGNPKFRKYVSADDYAIGKNNLDAEISTLRRLAKKENVERVLSLPKSKRELMKIALGHYPLLQPQRKKTPK